MGLFSDCKQMVKYYGISAEIGTIRGPVQFPIEISGVKVKPELLQTASAILQILDLLQFSTCKRIEALRKMKNVPQKRIIDLIIQQDEDTRMIANMAILLIASPKSAEAFEKVLSDWIAAAHPRAKRMQAKRWEPKESKELSEMEREIASVEKDLLELKSKEREMQVRKRDLEDKVSCMKDTLIASAYLAGGEFEVPFVRDGLNIKTNLEEQLSKAISVFPYLSKALSEKKPFEIRESMMQLTEKT